MSRNRNGNGNTNVKKAIIPPATAHIVQRVRMSPAIAANGFAFFTGMTGVGEDGIVPADPEQQFRNAFDKIGMILREGGMTFESVVEMTSYHVGLRKHFDLFDAIRLEYFAEPYPAWTAVEIAGLRREGAIVEIRVIAEISKDS